MLHKKKHGINFYTVWFAKEPLKKSGIIAYQEYMGDKPADAKECHTLLTDLTETEDEIKQHFSKTCRNLVNRAARENISYEIIENKDITDALIDEFCNFFEAFWESKGSKLENKQKLREEIRTYRDAEAFAIGCAYVNDEKAVYHTYINAGDTIRLRHSASLFRLQNSEESNAVKNLIGIANRGLHFEEMKYFKERGMKVYDWGGAGRNEEVLSITEFKETFGGAPITYCNFEQTNGLLAKLFKLLVKILGK